MSEDWALRNALHCRDAAAALEILRGRKVDVNLCDDSGRTPLHLAAEDEALLPVVHELLVLGANVNLPNAHGNTPLHRAAKHGHVQIALALRQHGADVQRKNSRGRTAAESSRTVALRDELLKGVEPELDSAESPGPGADDEPGALGASGSRAKAQAQAEAQAQAVRRGEKTAAAKVCTAPSPAPPAACFPPRQRVRTQRRPRPRERRGRATRLPSHAHGRQRAAPRVLQEAYRRSALELREVLKREGAAAADGGATKARPPCGGFWVGCPVWGG